MELSVLPEHVLGGPGEVFLESRRARLVALAVGGRQLASLATRHLVEVVLGEQIVCFVILLYRISGHWRKIPRAYPHRSPRRAAPLTS